MSCQNYSELFINTFIQTLAQLSAVIISGSLAVPVYNYYIKNNNIESDVVNKNDNSGNDNSDDNSSTITEDTDDTEDDIFRRGTCDSDATSFQHHQQFRMEEPDIVNH
jgi:DNA-directed RNA polymerase subunit M/transcription elongation factor TFIIS